MKVPVLLVFLFGGCPGAGDKGVDSAGADDTSATGSASCYVGVQFVCDELPDGTDTAVDDLSVSCSSRSGDFARPADCPTAAYEGKCTKGTGVDTTVQRFYTGADVPYAEDFCVNTAGGAWTTDW